MKTNRIKIVIVEDDAFYGEILRKYVSQVVDKIVPNCNTSIKHHISAEECLEALDPETNIFMLDYDLTGNEQGKSPSGLDLLEIVQKRCPNANTVIVTSYSDFTTINKFTLQGADRYILKNEDTPIRISAILKQLLEKSLSVS